MDIPLGAIVRRVSGYTPMVVTAYHGLKVEAVYCGGSAEPDRFDLNRLTIVRDLDEFAACSGWRNRLTQEQLNTLMDQINERATDMAQELPALYQTKEETPRFGTRIGEDSQGRIVLEIKGTGEAVAFERSIVERVMPYTVSIIEVGTGKTHTVRAQKGDVEVGDLVTMGGKALCYVHAVNTKSSSATEELSGLRFRGVAIGGAEVLE